MTFPQGWNPNATTLPWPPGVMHSLIMHAECVPAIENLLVVFGFKLAIELRS